MTFFFRFMRPLIEHGHVFIAFGAAVQERKEGKDVRYTIPRSNSAGFIAEMGDNVRVQRYKEGLGEMDPQQL